MSAELQEVRPGWPTHGVVDAHHHVWDLGVRDQPWTAAPGLEPLRRDFGLADLAPEAAAAGVTGTVVVQTVCTPGETPELLALAAASEAAARASGGPVVLGVVGWTDLAAPGVADELARLRELPGGDRLVAIRHQVQEEPDPGWLLRPEVLRGLRAVAVAGLAYDLVVRAEQLPAATAAAGAVPELSFVLDHLGKPPVAAGAPEPWSADLRALAARPNTAAKLSGLVTEAAPGAWSTAGLRPWADTALAAFGPDRLMFGSDWPVCTLAASYTEVLASARELTDGLSAAEQALVFRGTAARWYGG